MGIDQYGQTFHDLGDNPRQAILDIFGGCIAQKMFRDKKDGSVVQTGWIVRDHWVELFNVTSWEQPDGP
jgi:hypothetical protein